MGILIKNVSKSFESFAALLSVCGKGASYAIRN